MSAATSVQTQTAKLQPVSNSNPLGLLPQRKCACGSPTASLTGDCAECTSKKRLQTKLSIGASNDPLEQEADRVADQVLAAPVNPAVRSAASRLQRFTGHAAGENGTAPASVDRVLASPGRPLDPALQKDMGQRFGHDFSRVRIHTDADAARSADALNARAYALGSDIAFGAGMYAPATTEGRRVLTHELTHVVQQSVGGQSAALSAGEPHELEATNVASRLAAGASGVKVRRGTAVGLARDDEPTTAAHAGGAMGEVNAGFALGKMGFDIVIGPSGPGGHKLTARGLDIVAYNAATGELWIVDNKASGGTKGVQKADAMTKNLQTNLRTAINEIKGMKDFPSKATVLGKLDATLKAVTGKAALPSDVKLVVTNAGGYHTGIGKALAAKGVVFVDVVGKDTIAARKADVAAAKAVGDKTGRPVSHADTKKAAQSTKVGSATRAPVTPKATDFQTSGAPFQSDTSGAKIRPSGGASINSRGGRQKFRPRGGGLSQLLPAAINAFQDTMIRHRVASEMLGLWSRVEDARRKNPNDYIVFLVSLQEWAQPDSAGNVARAVHYVDFFHGPTEADAEAKGDNLLRQPVPQGWREVGPFVGVITPADPLAAAKKLVVSEEACFIATACYGSASTPEVAELRAWRDAWLMSRPWGRHFVAFYYCISPPIAALLNDHEMLRVLTRALMVGPIVWLVILLRPWWRAGGAAQRGISAGSRRERNQCGRNEAPLHHKSANQTDAGDVAPNYRYRVRLDLFQRANRGNAHTRPTDLLFRDRPRFLCKCGTTEEIEGARIVFPDRQQSAVHI